MNELDIIIQFVIEESVCSTLLVTKVIDVSHKLLDALFESDTDEEF